MFKRKRKNRVIKLNLDKTYEDERKPCERGVIEWSKDKKPEYEHEAVFKPLHEGRIFKKPQLILFGEGCVNAYKFDKTMKGLQTHWSEDEAQRVQEKQLALSIEKQKPFTWGQVILLAVPIFLNLILMVAMCNRLGIF
jgi:hypothetical protein